MYAKKAFMQKHFVLAWCIYFGAAAPGKDNGHKVSAMQCLSDPEPQKAYADLTSLVHREHHQITRGWRDRENNSVREVSRGYLKW